MPRVTRKSLTQSESPARMSPRASTKASSTSSRGSRSSTASAAAETGSSSKTPRGSRSKVVELSPAEAPEEVETKLPRRNQTKQGDGKDTSVAERGRSRSKTKGKSEETVDETPPARGGRSRSRGKPAPVEATTPKSRTRGKAAEHVEKETEKTTGRSRSKGKQSKVGKTENKEASEAVLRGKKKDDIASEDSGVETASPSKARSRSRGKGAAESSISSNVEKPSTSPVSESSRSSRSSSRGRIKEKPEEPESKKKAVQAKGRSTSRKRKEEKKESETSSTRRSGRQSSASVETPSPVSKQASKRKSSSPDQPVVKLTKLSDDVDMKCETKVSETVEKDEGKVFERECTDMLDTTGEDVTGENDKQDECVPEDVADRSPSTELAEQTSVTLTPKLSEDEMKETCTKEDESEEKNSSADEEETTAADVETKPESQPMEREAAVADVDAKSESQPMEREAAVADADTKSESQPVQQEAAVADVEAMQESQSVEGEAAVADVKVRLESQPVEQEPAVADVEARSESQPVDQKAAVADADAKQMINLDEDLITAEEYKSDEEPMETEENELPETGNSPERKSDTSEKVRGTEEMVLQAVTKGSDDTNSLELPVSLKEGIENTSVENRKRKFESDELTEDQVAKKICMNKEVREEVSKDTVQESVIEGISDVSSAEDEGSSSQNCDVLTTSQQPETTQPPQKSESIFSEINLAVEGKTNSLETETNKIICEKNATRTAELETQKPDEAEGMETEAGDVETLGEERVAEVSSLKETSTLKGSVKESAEAASWKEVTSESTTQLSETVEKAPTPDVKEAEDEDVTASYVLVSLDDVPPADGCELAAETSTIPQNHTEPVQQEQKEGLITESAEAAVSPGASSRPGNGFHSAPINNGIVTAQEEKVARTFEPSPDIFHRFYVSNPSVCKETIPETHKFKVATYNILAECHRQRADYSYTPDEFLCQDYRHELLMKELLHLDADVVCLQEVNPSYYSTCLLPALKSCGYEGTFMKRTQLKFDEGEATFYRTSRFVLESSRGVSLAVLAKENIGECGLSADVKEAVEHYLDRADVVNVCRLRCTRTNQIITVGNVHIVYDDLRSPDVQSIQIACAVKEVISQAGSDKNPYIICGDFNSTASSVGYQLAMDGYLSDSNIATLQSIENLKLQTGSKSLINHLWGAFQHTSSNLTSAYLTCQGEEPDVTTYNCMMLEGVDYVFYGSVGLGVQDILRVVDKDVVEESGGLPNKDFPSDHLSLSTTLFFK